MPKLENISGVILHKEQSPIIHVSLVDDDQGRNPTIGKPVYQATMKPSRGTTRQALTKVIEVESKRPAVVRISRIAKHVTVMGQRMAAVRKMGVMQRRQPLRRKPIRASAVRLSDETISIVSEELKRQFVRPGFAVPPAAFYQPSSNTDIRQIAQDESMENELNAAMSRATVSILANYGQTLRVLSVEERVANPDGILLDDIVEMLLKQFPVGVSKIQSFTQLLSADVIDWFRAGLEMNGSWGSLKISGNDSLVYRLEPGRSQSESAESAFASRCSQSNFSHLP